ncbi:MULTISPECIES: hypothetical protein [Pseudomonas]|uniref:hypothetical protein n=1 Tax=Pseudomonas TaxID=286 RepID=UPI0011AFE46C|nr:MULTISPECIES: hypothetical protein [Pseudomonas]
MASITLDLALRTQIPATPESQKNTAQAVLTDAPIADEATPAVSVVISGAAMKTASLAMK